MVAGDGRSSDRLNALLQLIPASREDKASFLLKYHSFLEMCRVVARVCEETGGAGEEGKLSTFVQKRNAAKLMELAASDGIAEEVVQQLIDLFTSFTRRESSDDDDAKDRLTFRDLVELLLFSFGLLGQRSLSEALGEVHESPPLLLLQSAIAEALWQQVSLSPSSHTKQDCEEEAGKMIQTLVWVARKHWRCCVEMAESAGTEEVPSSYLPVLETLTRKVAEGKHTLSSLYVHSSGDETQGGGGGGGKGSSSLGRALQLGSSFLSSVSSSGSGRNIGEGCEAVFIFVMGGVTADEALAVRDVGEFANGVKLHLLSTDLLSAEGVLEQFASSSSILMDVLTSSRKAGKGQ
mmetsp:Transcript_24852/g.81772  ORF Transcript_24852/g.81772 Transcript_24852/m.81772 type:complete len:350 (-) Transcript_24852:981-2030(-)